MHALLRLEKLDDILSHPVAGASWEGMVVENIIGAVGDRYDAHFYRTANGAEIDLILVSGGVPEIAIEVKRSTAPSVERGFHLACDDLGIEKRWLNMRRYWKIVKLDVRLRTVRPDPYRTLEPRRSLAQACAAASTRPD